MAGRGRGRGRGLMNSDLVTSPGGLAKETSEDKSSDSSVNDKEKAASSSPSTPTSESATLSIDDIQTILQDSRTYSDQYHVKKVLILVQNCVRSEKDVKSVACTIYQKCMEDSSLAKRGAEICDSLTVIEVGNVKFRSCLLSLIQADFKIRKDILSDSPTHYNGFLAFLCEIFNVMRTTTGEVFKPLVGPIFDCFNLVLGVEEQEDDEGDGGFVDAKEVESLDDDTCDLFAIQLQYIGRLLEQLEEQKMKKLMNRVRTCVIHSKSSPRARCSLLEGLEAYIRSWEPALNDTTKFYCDMSVNIISGLVL